MALRSKLLILLTVVGATVLYFSQLHADTSASFVPVSGTDTTNGTESVLTTTSNGDIFKLSAVDDKRMASNTAWPSSGSYDETKYIEFIFNPNISSDAVVSSVTVTHKYRRGAILTAAKLEVWDGSLWQDVPIALPPTTGTNSDFSETKDIGAFITTPAKVNGVKIRFLAYRNTYAASATTSHDFLQLTVGYTSSETPTSTPTPESTSTPSATPEVTPSPTPEPSPTPNPQSEINSRPNDSVGQASFVETPTPTPVVYFVSPSPSNTPTPTLIPSPTASPSFSPTPEATLSISLEFTPNPLVAVIYPPKIVYRRVLPAPVVSIIPVPLLQSISRIQQVKIAVVNIWHLLTHYLSMIGK